VFEIRGNRLESPIYTVPITHGTGVWHKDWLTPNNQWRTQTNLSGGGGGGNIPPFSYSSGFHLFESVHDARTYQEGMVVREKLVVLRVEYQDVTAYGTGYLFILPNENIVAPVIVARKIRLDELAIPLL
jgi:hypothetical protein